MFTNDGITKSSLNQDMQENTTTHFPKKTEKKRLFSLSSWSWHFHTEVLHLYQDLFRLSRLFLDFDHRIYFSAWMDMKKGWICATFVTGNPYGTRVLGKSSQISDWAGTHWSRDIGDLNRTLTCPSQDREVFLPLNCLPGFDFKCWITCLKMIPFVLRKRKQCRLYEGEKAKWVFCV